MKTKKVDSVPTLKDTFDVDAEIFGTELNDFSAIFHAHIQDASIEAKPVARNRLQRISRIFYSMIVLLDARREVYHRSSLTFDPSQSHIGAILGLESSTAQEATTLFDTYIKDNAEALMTKLAAAYEPLTETEKSNTHPMMKRTPDYSDAKPRRSTFIPVYGGYPSAELNEAVYGTEYGYTPAKEYRELPQRAAA